MAYLSVVLWCVINKSFIGYTTFYIASFANQKTHESGATRNGCTALFFFAWKFGSFRFSFVLVVGKANPQA
jgi:hypothetical protein